MAGAVERARILGQELLPDYLAWSSANGPGALSACTDMAEQLHWRWTVTCGRGRVRHPQAHLEWLWLGKKGGLTASGMAQMLERRGNQAGLPGLHPTASDIPSPTSGWPKAVVKRT